MGETGEAILIAALDLPESDRWQIVDKLFETIPENDVQLETDLEAWRASLPDEKPIISMRLPGADDMDEPDQPCAARPPLSDAARSLLDAALAATLLDRAIVVEELLASFGPPPGWVEVTDEQFRAELQRRMEECERDPDSCIPWEQVRDMR